MVTVVRSGEETTVKDDEGKELEGYFCPFAGEMCYEGDVIPEEIVVPKGKCQFWERDTVQAPQCKLLRAAAGLAAVSEIPGMLHNLAAQGKE